MLSTESVIEKVTQFVRELKGAGLHLHRAILFGSYADGCQKEWSDIDLAHIADEFIGFGFEDRKFFSAINIKKEYLEIETKTFPPAEFEAGNGFIDKIKKTGIEIKV